MNKSSFTKTGMIIFPMLYCDNENYLKAYILARDLANNIIAMFIHPKEADIERAKHNSSTVLPSVEEFGDTSLRASTPCYASMDNNKHNTNGILLCEQVEAGKIFIHNDENGSIEVQAYRCKWASVLCDYSESSLPAIGLGYLEIDYAYEKEGPKSYASIQSQIKQYKQLENDPNIPPLDKEDQLVRLYEGITVERKKIFKVVNIKHNKIVNNVETRNINELRNIIESLCTQYCVNGRYGLVLIRVRDGNTVLSKASSRYEMGFNYKTESICTANENWDKFVKYQLKYLNKYLNNPNLSIDLIPAQVINFAFHGMDKMSKEFCTQSSSQELKGATKLMKQYIDRHFHFKPDVDLVKNSAFLVSWIGVRTSRIRKGKSKGNEIASTIHSFSTVFGNALQVTNDLEHRFKMDFELNDSTMQQSDRVSNQQVDNHNNQQGGGYNNQQGGGYNNQQGGGYNNQQGGGYNNQQEMDCNGQQGGGFQGYQQGSNEFESHFTQDNQAQYNTYNQ